MADIELEVRGLLERAADQPVAEPPLAQFHAKAARRGRRRQGLQLAGVSAAIAGIVAGVVVAASGRTTARPLHIPPATAGPTASQLAHGHWVQIPEAPIDTCSPTTVPTGSGVIVLETGVANNCSAGAALYDATTNRWHVIAAPSRSLGQLITAAWGDGRLIVIARMSGVAMVWRPSTDRWTALRPVPTLPLGRVHQGVTSVTWTGGGFAIADVTGDGVHTFLLDPSGRWRSTGQPPPPVSGTAVGAQVATLGGTTYLMENTYREIQLKNGGFTYAVHVELFARSRSGWSRIAASLGKMRAASIVSSLQDALLAFGEECPGCQGGNSQISEILQPLGGPNGSLRISNLNLRTGFTTYALVAGGGNAVAAIYPDGEQATPNSDGRNHARADIYRNHARADIYDVPSQLWLRAPAPPAGIPAGVFWTSRGVLDLSSLHVARENGPGRTGGALLVP